MSKKKLYGTYYTQGQLSKKDRKWIYKLLKKGILVYHQYGKPSCGPTGCN